MSQHPGPYDVPGVQDLQRTGESHENQANHTDSVATALGRRLPKGPGSPAPFIA
jgi:hypothetical protein